jgi:cytochrome c oxidase cbb3-type subunit 2
MRATLVVAGVLGALACGIAAIIWVPNAEFGRMAQVEDSDLPGVMHPGPLNGLANLGRDVYVANGCVHCHSQQVGEPGAVPDVARNWGPRRTVPRDYLDTRPGLIGVSRVGPDLSNIGTNTAYTAAFHLLHLYSPRLARTDASGYRRHVAIDSICQPNPHLFVRQAIGAAPSPEALPVPGLPAGEEVVPTEQARALVAYLMALNRTYPLPEAPVKSK